MTTDWVTTSAILASLRDYQNSAAWSSFAARFRSPILRFARSLGLGDNDAEDVAQETLIAFAEAFRSGQYDRTKGRLSRWLFGIAYRQALSERRGGARRAAKEVQATSMLRKIPDESQATAMWDREWEESLLEQCLERVRTEVEPTTYRAFELVVRAERSAEDAANELGVPIKTIYNAKHRVLKRIRELRSELDEIDSPSRHEKPAG